MGRSQAYVAPAPSEKSFEDMVQCEVQNNDEHEVRPPTWPPPRIGNQAGDPSMSLRCVRCGTNVIVYSGHATGKIAGVKVVLPKSK